MHSKKKRALILQNVGTNATCQITSCGKVIPFTNLVAHLKQHIKAGLKIHCPVDGCGREMKKISSFSAHISVKHRCITRLNVSKHIINPGSEDTIPDCDVDSGNIADVSFESSNMIATTNAAQMIEQQNETGIDLCDEVDTDLFTVNLAQFFLKLQCRFHIPNSTVAMIANEFQNIHSLATDNCMNKLQKRLLLEQVDSDKVTAIINDIKRNDLVYCALNQENGTLRSQHKWRGYIKEKFHFVEPVQILLGQNKFDKPAFCHYIPLENTLTALLQDESIKFWCDSVRVSRMNVYEDICDGEVFRKVTSSVDSSHVLELILYQDAFELVNPLGSARKCHKLLAMYLALGNLPAHKRMSVDNLQLVFLCRESDLNFFGQSKVFGCLMSDLQHLEEKGICFQNKTYAVRLYCVLGDNLGSHWLGGFTTNFSVNNFVCRYCLVKRNKEDKTSLCCTADLRTNDNYDAAALTASQQAAACQGVIGKSILNELKFFHVCMPGLPPCLGHDLFEGIIQYDLALILKKLSDKKGDNHMSYTYLNNSIKHFKFGGFDANDRPGIVSDGKTVGGHAVQNWCLLRLLPLLVFGAVDINSEAWELLLLLREVVELVCAPKVSHDQVLLLNRLVTLYVNERSKMFAQVALRPKHHYLLHYPWLIQMFGPLIHVWTMRMESKHTFFKRCSRSAQNFINITKTLSETHQFSQAYQSGGRFLLATAELSSDSMVFDRHLFSDSICTAVCQCYKLSDSLQCSSAVTVNGTLYHKGAYVVLGRDESQPIFGSIILCVLDDHGKCSLIVAECKSVKNPNLGLYVMLDNAEQESFKCILIEELYDYCPLPGYTVNGVQHVTLKHAIFDDAQI
jgi:hypothetical protein